MNKKFKIINLEKLIIQFEEDIKKNETINLSEYLENIELNSFFENFKNILNSKYVEEQKKEWESKKRLEIEKINLEKHKEIEKLRSDLEVEKIKSLEKLTLKNNSLENDIETLKKQEKTNIELEKSKLESKHLEETNSLNNNIKYKDEEIKNLKKQNDQEIQRLRSELEVEKIKSLEKLNIENNSLKNDIENLKEQEKRKIELEKSKLENKHLEETNLLNNNIKNKEQKIQELIKEIDSLKREKSTYNVKRTGEDLESWCLTKIEEECSLINNNIFIDKAQLIKNEENNKFTKSDFVVQIKNTVNNNNFKIVLEMKSEVPNSVNKKRNIDYINQLKKDCEKNKADIGILVTELEKEQDFVIKKHNIEDSTTQFFIIRPNVLTSFINLLQVFFNKFSKEEISEINFLEVEEIRKTWDDFNLQLNKTSSSIEKEIKSIIEHSEKIKDLASKIEESASDIIDKKFKTLTKKINDFKIERKIIKKLENTKGE